MDKNVIRRGEIVSDSGKLYSVIGVLGTVMYIQETDAGNKKVEPLKGRSFTINQLHEVYRDLADKKEYPDFDCWFTDMLKSGVFETI